MKVSKQQKIQNTLSDVDDTLGEVNVLLGISRVLRDAPKDGDDEHAEFDREIQVGVLDNIISERMHSLYHRVEFLQRATAPRPKAKLIQRPAKRPGQPAPTPVVAPGPTVSVTAAPPTKGEREQES